MNNPYLVFFAGLAVLGLLFWYFATDIDRRKRNIGSMLVAAVLGLSIWALVPPDEKLKPGIDLAGGSAFTVEVQPKIGEDGIPVPVSISAVDKAIETLEGRLNPKGEKDLLIQRQGTNRIIIEMPGISEDEAESVRRRIKETARLELRKVHPQSSFEAPRVAAGEAAVPGYTLFEYEFENDDGEKRTEQLLLSKRVQVEGKHVQSAAADTLERGTTNIRLSGEGGDRMINLTKDMTRGRDRIAVVLDGKVLSAPVVQAVPLGRNFIIEGLDSYEEANDLAASLMNPLENPLEILEDREVSPRLGKATIQQGIYAGIAGLGLTLIFVLLYYRLAGMIALLGLLVNIVILFGAMAMFGFTFTLPGIAGIILTIGVAVDANVLIYERLREELKLGKSVRAAIQAAYEKAFSAIFDANITTLITALILFWRASGTVKGFAVTLTIGILASMFAALVGTRVLFWWCTDGNILKKLNFLNLVPEKSINFMGMRKGSFFLSTIVLIGALAVTGIKQDEALGVDFVGGTLIKFQLGDATVTEETVKESIADLELTKVATVQEEASPASGNFLAIRCATEDAEKITEEVRKDIPALAEMVTKEIEEDGVKRSAEVYKISAEGDQISGTLGKEFLRNSIIALGIGLVAILFYITVRFEFSFAVGAFAALFHDLIICIGIVVVSGMELSLIHVGAFLTIAGYSINDTIVVFDRIRETLRSKRGEVEEVMNLAINSTLSRTLLTSMTTFLAVLVLFIFGGPALKAFSFAIMIGVVIGTYSSIFVASPIVLLWSKFRGSNLRRELLDANLEAQVNPARS